MRRRLLLFVLFLLLTIPLSLLLAGLVRDVLLPGCWRVYWGVRTLFESVPQVPIWDLLVAGLLVLAASSLMRRRRSHREVVSREVEHQGRVQLLTQQIQRTSQGEYFKWDLAHSLGDLALEVLAHRERTTAEQAKQRLWEDGLNLSPEIRAYLQSGQSPRFSKSGGLLAKIGKRWARMAPSRPFDPALPEVVQFLEDQLDIKP